MRIGPILIRSYAALINIGLLVGAALAALEARRRSLHAPDVLDAALAAALGGLLVARAAYVGIHWNYYTNHLRQALRLRDGGLAWQGALVGGMAGAAILCACRRKGLLVTLDALTSGAASVAVFAWLGCFQAGCAHGLATFPWQGLLWVLSLDLPDLYGIYEPRVAVQLLGAGWSALVLGLILVAQRNARRGGSVFALWLTLQSLGSYGLGLLRGDQTAIMGGWRVDQAANLALGATGIAALFLCGLALKAGSGPSHQEPESETEVTR